MRIQPALLWTWNARLDRIPYLLVGVSLFAVKFATDWTIARFGFGINWSPINYLIWPNDRVLRVFELGDAERGFSLTMLLVSLPFIWIGVMLTMHRLRATGLPLVLIVLFFLPLVNLLLFLMLVLLPAEARAEAVEPTPEPSAETSIKAGEPPLKPRLFEPLRATHRSIVLESYWRSGVVALLITVPLTVLGVFLEANVLHSYGFSLFIGSPFLLGMFSVLLFGFSRPKPFGACVGVAMLSGLFAGFAILMVALEGIVCLIMLAPMAVVLIFLGAVVGYAIQARPWLNDQTFGVMVALIVMLPALMAAESAHEPEPIVRAVHTEVIIDAPPAKVWPHVIAFPPLAEPDDWFFQTGIAYPQRAEIHGKGVGAVRHCVFSTGTFVEPIDVWDEPTLLRFRVTEQPAPMKEWSPYPIHPAHLDHYLVSERGQFHLEALPDGRTRLIGTTWYSNRMWPAPYWNLWSDYIIHRIHGRVLDHIRTQAEN